MANAKKLAQVKDPEYKLVPAKIYSRTWDVIKKRVAKAITGNQKEPTFAEIIDTAVMVHATGAREFATADPRTPTVVIPKSVVPVVKHILWLFAAKRSPEYEELKDRLRFLAAQHEKALEVEAGQE